MIRQNLSSELIYSKNEGPDIPIMDQMQPDRVRVTASSSKDMVEFSFS